MFVNLRASVTTVVHPRLKEVASRRHLLSREGVTVGPFSPNEDTSKSGQACCLNRSQSGRISGGVTCVFGWLVRSEPWCLYSPLRSQFLGRSWASSSPRKAAHPVPQRTPR